MRIKARFRNAKIITKFNLLLALAFLIGTLLSGATLWRALEYRAETEVASKAAILMEVMNSIRNYTQDRVNPLLKARLETGTVFIPEAIPTFPVREVFEYFRSDPDYENFFYKDAAPNPTNLRDQADDFETKLVEEFRRQLVQEKSGWRNLPEGKVFYMARPFQLTKQRCLQCHSSPEIAPKSLLTAYGTENGFGWKLNEVVATQIVYVPAEEILASARNAFIKTGGIFIGTLITILVLINLLLRRTVIERIRKIVKTAQAVSMGETVVNFEENSKDEIGLLSIAFNRMKSSLEVAMKLLNQQRMN